MENTGHPVGIKLYGINEVPYGATHTRWLMTLPPCRDDALTEWLHAHGASATYRGADPPGVFYAYFPPGLTPPRPFRSQSL